MEPLKHPSNESSFEESQEATENPQEASSETAEERPVSQPSPAGSIWKRLSKNVLIFAILALVLIAAYCVVNIDRITGFVQMVGDIVVPLFIGAIIAYLCNPILEFYEYRVLRRVKSGGLRRGFSLLFTVLTVLSIIALLLLMILPKLIESIGDLATNYPTYVNNLIVGITDIVSSVAQEKNWNIDVNALETTLRDFFGDGQNLFNSIMSFINKDSDLVAGIGNALLDIVTVFKNWILGIFIAFYILSSKEKRVAQINKFRRAMFSKKQNDRISEVISLADNTFSGYVFGVLIDALVVGVLTFMLLTIFAVSPKYNLLISVICAATNIIPVFGPFIGAIPSALIVLISNPSKFFLFILLILVIQQIDGNLLCPKIQGDNTGISSLAVLVAITIAGSIGGIGGMIVGVPIFAVFIELVKRFLEHRLDKLGEPTDTTAYYSENAVGNAEKDVYYEHAPLRYKYEHSRFKPRFERFKKRVFKHMGRHHSADIQGSTESAENHTPTDDSSQEES